MTTDQNLHVLIVDDERPARRRIERLLNQQEDITICGQAEDGRQAIEAIRKVEPDLVFLDVQMPEYSGIDVVREIGPERMPKVIFVTAYDEYALEAFEIAALDYLLKPFDNKRFQQALNRARKTVVVHEVEAFREQLSSLLDEVTPTSGSTEEEPDYLERITVKTANQVRVIPVEKIDFITASDNYAELHVGEETHLIRERMKHLEDRLDPTEFVRVHRSSIVRLDRIESLLLGGGGNCMVKLTDGRRLRVSRRRREDVEERLGVDS